jgi:hypothetical protein
MNQFYKITLIAFLFSCLAAPIFAQTTYTFTTAGSWNVAGNWAGGNYPPQPLPSGDFIVIDANCT